MSQHDDALHTSSYINKIQPQSSALSMKVMRSAVNQPVSVNNTRITYANQDNLPRLPVPTLEDTLAQLPSCLEAILDPKDYDESKKVIKDFLENEGPSLQQKLVEYERHGFDNDRIGSYVEAYWNESYLSPDVSTVLNLNPFFILENGPDPKIATNQLRRAASLCFSSLKFASALRNETLAPDMVKGKPLCMDQFKVLFGSSRQPVARLDTEQDDVHVYRDSSHVVVMYRNQFYYFSALLPDSFHVAVDDVDILDILKGIIRHADASMTDVEASCTALGVLTSLPRSEWAVARKELCDSHESNRLALKVIDSALFVLVLDDFAPGDINTVASNALHGTNTLVESDTLQMGSCLNRWYDKLQIIVCKDGSAQINFEHATIDGHTALRFVSDIYADAVIRFADSIVRSIHGEGRIVNVIEAVVERVANKEDYFFDVHPKKLVFELSKSTLDRIRFAEAALCDNILATDTCVLEFSEYGKNLIVANKMSPDAYVQMSILLAYYKFYGRVVCMYEPAMTKSFYHGRTEAIRGTTRQAKEFCRTFCNDEATPEEKMLALRLAVSEHSRRTKESSCGKGIDRHLFALKCLASQLGHPIPKFYDSVAWKTLNHSVLSTSNCGNSSLRLFGFGPVVPDGFGIGYIIKDSGISYSVTSKHRQTRRFVRSLQTSLQEMELLLTKQYLVNVRPHLSDVTAKEKRARLGSYGDMWGADSVPIPATGSNGLGLSSEKLLHTSTRASKVFSKVTEREEKSIELLSIRSIKIDVDMGNSDASC